MNGVVVDNNTVTAGDTPAATPVRYIGTDFIGKIDAVSYTHLRAHET